MSASFLLVGGVVGLAELLVMLGIRFRVVTVVQATIVMILLSAGGAALVVFGGGGESIQAACMGSLLAFAFGLWTFVLGRALEQRVSKPPK
jgi:hypothetical protein